MGREIWRAAVALSCLVVYAALVLVLAAGCDTEARVPMKDYQGALWSYQYMRDERERVERLLIDVCKKHRAQPGVREDCHGYADVRVYDANSIGGAQRIYPPGHPECATRPCLATGSETNAR